MVNFVNFYWQSYFFRLANKVLYEGRMSGDKFLSHYDKVLEELDSFLDDYGSIYVLFERNSIVTITYVFDNNIYERQMSYDIGIYQDNGNYKENIIYV